MACLTETQAKFLSRRLPVLLMSEQIRYLHYPKTLFLSYSFDFLSNPKVLSLSIFSHCFKEPGSEEPGCQTKAFCHSFASMVSCFYFDKLTKINSFLSSPESHSLLKGLLQPIKIPCLPDTVFSLRIVPRILSALGRSVSRGFAVYGPEDRYSWIRLFASTRGLLSIRLISKLIFSSLLNAFTCLRLCSRLLVLKFSFLTFQTISWTKASLHLSIAASLLCAYPFGPRCSFPLSVYPIPVSTFLRLLCRSVCSYERTLHFFLTVWQRTFVAEATFVRVRRHNNLFPKILVAARTCSI